MTQQAENNNPGTTASSLWAKLQRFAGALTPEEEAQLSSMQPGTITGNPSPSLRAKAQQAVDELTQEEVAHLRLLLQRSGAVVAGEADVEGFMIGQFDDGQGNKGRPQPVTGTGGGGGFPDRFSHNVKVLFGPLVDELPLIPR